MLTKHGLFLERIQIYRVKVVWLLETKIKYIIQISKKRSYQFSSTNSFKKIKPFIDLKEWVETSVGKVLEAAGMEVDHQNRIVLADKDTKSSLRISSSARK